MLVLSRYEGESIIVGDDITITVVEIRGGGKVRLGIEAPPHVRVDRREIRELRDGQRDAEGGAA